MFQCNCCDDSEQVKDVVGTLFSMGILMAEAQKEKETEKMGKITIRDCACKKFEDFRVGECFAHMGTVYMRIPSNMVGANSLNLETGAFKEMDGLDEFAPVHEFHWTDKK